MINVRRVYTVHQYCTPYSVYPMQCVGMHHMMHSINRRVFMEKNIGNVITVVVMTAIWAAGVIAGIALWFT